MSWCGLLPFTRSDRVAACLTSQGGYNDVYRDRTYTYRVASNCIETAGFDLLGSPVRHDGYGKTQCYDGALVDEGRCSLPLCVDATGTSYTCPFPPDQVGMTYNVAGYSTCSEADRHDSAAHEAYPSCERDAPCNPGPCGGVYGICCHHEIARDSSGSVIVDRYYGEVASQFRCLCENDPSGSKRDSQYPTQPSGRYSDVTTWYSASPSDWTEGFCQPKVRACCEAAPNCRDCWNLTQEECTRVAGNDATWYHNKTCADNPCVYGACCGCDWCVDSCKEADCMAAGGLVWRRSTVCANPGRCSAMNPPQKCLEGRFVPWSPEPNLYNPMQSFETLFSTTGLATDVRRGIEPCLYRRATNRFASSGGGLSDRAIPTACAMWTTVSALQTDAWWYYGSYVPGDDGRWEAKIAFREPCKPRPT